VSAAATPTPEQEQRARWDLLLLDLEHRAEQVRQLKVYEGKRLVIQAVTSAGVLLGAGGAIGAALTNWLLRGHV
jgi:hypothetical protein